jgi:hypothetical protein
MDESGWGAVFGCKPHYIIREVTVTELHPNNMNSEDGLVLKRPTKPLTLYLREWRLSHSDYKQPF